MNIRKIKDTPDLNPGERESQQPREDERPGTGSAGLKVKTNVKAGAGVRRPVAVCD
jgi:hypothetical protein